MQDRLQELRVAVAKRSVSLVDHLPNNNSVIFDVRRNDITDLGVFEEQLGTDHDKQEGAVFMADYLSQINKVKESVAYIRSQAGIINQLKNELLQTATPDEEQKVSNQINKVLNNNNRVVLSIKQELERLRHENDVFHSKNPSSSETKIRENMHAAITRNFRELLTEFQAIQTAYKKAVRDKIERQVKIVHPDVTDFEMQEILLGGDSNIAQQQIFARITGAHESLNYAYQDISDKHKDVKRLEQSVAELHQMFVDLATLVDQQGEMLDQIDYAVTNAADYTEKADKDLIVAQKIQKKQKKWGCIISCCLIFVVLLVVLPIIVYITK